MLKWKSREDQVSLENLFCEILKPPKTQHYLPSPQTNQPNQNNPTRYIWEKEIQVLRRDFITFLLTMK